MSTELDSVVSMWFGFRVRKNARAMEYSSMVSENCRGHAYESEQSVPERPLYEIVYCEMLMSVEMPRC